VVDDVQGDPVGAILRRLTFLHDRLAFVAPEIASVAYTAQRGGRIDAVATTRHDMAAMSYSLAVNIGDTQHEPSAFATFVVDVPSAGGWTSSVIFEAADETSLTDDARRELEITTLVAMSGRHLEDIEAWPAGLARSQAALRTMRDLEGGAHLARLAVYSRLVAAALVDPLGLDEEFVEAVGLYAPLHDVGEMDLPEGILLKPSRLDSSEWDIMKSHTVLGRAMVDEAMSADPSHPRWVCPDALRSIVELHHEALDGHGYPHGLRGDDVPLEARVVTIADVFDALTNSRPYKPGWPVEQALEEMDRMVAAGTIDGWCLTALATQLDALEQVVAQGHEVEGRIA
jgi:HD-GYP domain-containing protein (c-di-GMP phosphodiesterase class II)